MTKKQEFQESVAQVIQAETVTQIHFGEGRPLTDQERVELNNKVNELRDQYEEPGGKTWRFLHRAIGVDNIKAMRLAHLNSAHAILDLLLERAQLSRALEDFGDLADANGMLSKSLNEVSAKLVLAEQGASKAERALTDARLQCRRAELVAAQARKQRNRMRVLAGGLSLVSLGAIAMSYHHLQQLKVASAWSSLCILDDKTYAVGTTVEGRPGWECALSDSGLAAWQSASKRSR